MKKNSKSNLLKAVSLGTAMAALLSSVSPVFAAGLSITGATTRSSNLTDVPYPFGSHGSIVFAGDDDYCGVDNVVGRGGKQQEAIKDSQRITAKEQYERFVYEKEHNGRAPYGTTTKKVTWVAPGGILSDPKSTYMGTNTFGSENILPEAYGIYSFVTGCGASATGNYSTAFGAGATTKAGGAQAFGVSALASGIASVAVGVDSEAAGESAVAIGGLATALGKNSVAVGTKVRAESNYAIAIGVDAKATGSGSIAIGSRLSNRTEENDPNRKLEAQGENSIAIGTFAYAKNADAVAIGVNAQVFEEDGVAIGGGSVSRRKKGADVYDPATGNIVNDKTGLAWRSTAGAFSIGEVGSDGNDGQGILTRQITGVAAGKEDTDAVNVAQLKALRSIVKAGEGGGSWQISANDLDLADVSAGSIVDFSVKKSEVGKDNLTIAKESTNNKHKIQITLADKLNLTQVTTGQSSMSDDGFFVDNKNGPRMTIDGFFVDNENGPRMTEEGFFIKGDRNPSMTIHGIDAGFTSVRNLLDATEEHEAVNLGQMKEYVQEHSGGSWKLSVEQKDATEVKSGDTVHFFAITNNATDTKNIKIANTDGKNVSFDLNENIRVETVTAGNSIITNDGFGFINGNGPKIMANGIDADGKKITKVAEGTEDTDAVNYKQLKDVKQLAENGWKLSVDGKNATDVGAGSTVDLVAGADDNNNKNIRIVKSNGNKVTFTLDSNLNLTSVTTGNSIMNNDGFAFVDGGPSITAGGIKAGNTQITDVADAKSDTDAVNYKQLKAIKQLAENGWKLSVDGDDGTNVGAGDTVKFTPVNKNDNKNITIVRGDKNEVQFDLAENIKVKSVTAGNTLMDEAGYGFVDDKGPKITIDGIDLKNKKIKGVANGTEDNDAVNFSQLKEIKNEIAGDSLVKWDDKKKSITIGAQKDGTKIDIANNSGDARKISGVEKGRLYQDSTEAVNGSQLWDTNETVKHIDKKVTDISNTIIDMGEQIDGFAQDALLWNKEEGAFSARHEKDGRKTDSKITNILDGDIYIESKDAINGSQIDKISKDIAKFFGGDAVFEGGKFIGPKYNLSKVSADGTVVQHIDENVGDALTTLDANVKNVNSRIKYVDNKFDKFAQDSLLWDEGAGAFSARHEKDGRKTDSKITSLLKGDVTKNSTDAINGSQLYTMGDKIADYFGGVANYENGTWVKGPEFKVTERNENGDLIEGTYFNVTDAFNGVDNSITDIYNQINNVTENSLVKQEGENGLITVGKETGGTKISIANKNNQERTIFGVKAAELSRTSTEAVNGSQLFATDERVATVTGDLLKVAQNTSKYFGGNTDVLNGVEPAFLIDGKPYHNVTDAFTGVNVSIHKIDNKISNLEKNNLVQQEGGVSGIITIGKDTAGTEINIAGYAGAGRTISGVRAAEKGDEAVNKDQLDKSIEKISKDIETASIAAVLYDKNEDGTINYGSVTLGGDKNKTPVALLNVKDGRIAANSTDAINGGQLYFMSNQLASYFGGGAKYDNGEWKAPTFKTVQVNADGTTVEKSHNNVADAFDGIKNNMSNINNRIDDVINKVDSDALKWNSDKKAYDANRDGKPNKIINVADGKVEKNSKDAVNGGQLWQTNERVAKVENRVTDVENHVEIIDKRVDNISNTIGDIGDTITNINVKVDKMDDKVNNIAEDAVRYDRDANGKKTNKITLKGSDPSEPVMIDNVADGRIEKGSKEAVNGGQLQDYTKEQMKIVLDESKKYTDQRVNNIVIDAIDDAVDKSKQYTDMKFNALNYSIEGVRKEARQAAAIGLAVANLRYNDTPGKLSVGFGSGLWRSQSAFAFGAGYTSEKGNIRSNVSITTSGGHWGVGAGFNMTLN